MIKAVLFDLDGTLADTAPDLVGAVNRLLIEHGQSPQDDEIMRPLASHGARALVSRGFSLPADHPDLDPLCQRFLALYLQYTAERSTLFNGIDALLQELTARGLIWGIITNKHQRFTERLIPALPFPSTPAVIVSGDTVGVSKPDPRPMLHACETIGIDAQHCIYVGDARRDIEAGRNVGMRTVLANWGYIGPDDHPEDWGADIRINTPQDLLHHL
jgi:2-phosphoglycolate phosphatase